MPSEPKPDHLAEVKGLIEALRSLQEINRTTITDANHETLRAQGRDADNRVQSCLRNTLPAIEALVAEVERLRWAANCALWLLSTDRMQPIVNSNWGDPCEIKRILEEAGCKPVCDVKPNANPPDGLKG